MLVSVHLVVTIAWGSPKIHDLALATPLRNTKGILGLSRTVLSCWCLLAHGRLRYLVVVPCYLCLYLPVISVNLLHGDKDGDNTGIRRLVLKLVVMKNLYLVYKLIYPLIVGNSKSSALPFDSRVFPAILPSLYRVAPVFAC